jgi:ferredoxin
MRIVVDRNLCTGQAMCESIAPDIFHLNADGVLEVLVAVVPDGLLGEAEQAVDCCPNLALEIVP